MNAVIATILGILGLVVAVAIPIIGFVIRQLYSRITEVKSDTKEILEAMALDYKQRIAESKSDAKTLVLEEERRRGEAIGGVMTQVNSQYSDLKREMHGLREDLKGIRDAK